MTCHINSILSAFVRPSDSLWTSDFKPGKVKVKVNVHLYSTLSWSHL